MPFLKMPQLFLHKANFGEENTSYQKEHKVFLLSSVLILGKYTGLFPYDIRISGVKGIGKLKIFDLALRFFMLTNMTAVLIRSFEKGINDVIQKINYVLFCASACRLGYMCANKGDELHYLCKKLAHAHKAIEEVSPTVFTPKRVDCLAKSFCVIYSSLGLFSWFISHYLHSKKQNISILSEFFKDISFETAYNFFSSCAQQMLLLSDFIMYLIYFTTNVLQITTSVYLQYLLKKINHELSEHLMKNDSISPVVLNLTMNAFVITIEALRTAIDVFSDMLFCDIASSIPYLCYHIGKGFKHSMSSNGFILHDHHFTVLLFSARLFLILWMHGETYNQVTKTYYWIEKAFASVNSSWFPFTPKIVVASFIVYGKNEPVFNAGGFFNVTKSLIITISGAMLTYSFLLFQL